MKVSELRNKNVDELKEELVGLRREQFNLRMQRGVNPDAVRNNEITRVRKDIARVKTVINENRGGTES